MLSGERFDVRVLLQIFRRDILNVVIDGEHRLCGICDRRSADLFELWNYRAGIVVRHHMTRTNRDEIASPHHGSHGESISVSRGNLLDEREAHISFFYVKSVRAEPMSIHLLK